MAEHPDPELVDEPLADPTGEGGAERGGQGGQQDRADEGQRHGDEHVGVPFEHAAVDADLDQQRAEVEERGLGNDQQDRECEADGVGPQEGPQPEGAAVPAAVGEVDDGVRVLGFMGQDRLDAVGEVAGHVGERQAGVGVCLHRRGPDGDAPAGVSEAHQVASRPVGSSWPFPPEARIAA